MNTFFRYLVSILALLILWKLVSIGVPSLILPPPETAFAAFGRAIKTRAYWGHFGVSAYRVVAGMAVAYFIAFPLGIFIGYNRRADRFLSPSVFLTYPIPKIVLLPIFLMLFGLGDLSKILMIALIIGYQILVATRDSVLGVDKKYIDSFRSIGGNPGQAIRFVIVPAALPHAFTALRIGSGTGIAVLFFVESFATQRGLGYFIMDAWGVGDVRLMFAGIIGMSVLGIVLYETFNYLEKNICAWKYFESGRVPAKEPGPPILIGRIQDFGRMIKFSHTVFALPFALAAVVLAQKNYPISGSLLFWILAAMVGARSAAMGFNRIVDASYDAQNPRTAQRALPAGTLSMKTAVLFVVLFSGVFILAAGMISRLCLVLSFPVLAVLFLYSYTKRFTLFSHLILGFAISLGPLGAWIAVTGSFDWPILLLSLALMAYIAGFDILYACQDEAFDREIGLYSIPARLGAPTAFHISTILHAAAFVFLFLIFIAFDLGVVYLSTVVIIGCLLVIEHKLVKPHDLAHIDIAFFHVNSVISILLFVGILGDELARKLF